MDEGAPNSQLIGQKSNSWSPLLARAWLEKVQAHHQQKHNRHRELMVRRKLVKRWRRRRLWPRMRSEEVFKPGDPPRPSSL